MKQLIALTSCVLLSACAGLAPSAADMAKIPQVRFGDPIPADGKHITFFPAGTALPVSSVVDGNLFEQTGQASLQVKLKRDVYLYRQFASFDGKNWQASNKLISTLIEMQVPSQDGKSAGVLHIQMDQK